MNIGTATVTSERRVTLPGIEPAEPGSRFEAVLPWPPSVNPYWRFFILNGSVRHALSTMGLKYRKATVKAVGTVRPLTGPLHFAATLHPPTLARMDLDNRIKPLLDALTVAGVFGDDSQVREMRVAFGAKRPGGAVAVRVVPLAESDVPALVVPASDPFADALAFEHARHLEDSGAPAEIVQEAFDLAYQIRKWRAEGAK